MTNVVDQSAWWNPLLISVIFTWLGGTAIYITNKKLIALRFPRICLI